ncbi:MAG TPA: pantoate--beta-alanine ligase [Gemmatimonadaceae bacterium]|nr:pantoate--beta-alanine ligase [Gemmatimonadaceae bacterium]
MTSTASRVATPVRTVERVSDLRAVLDERRRTGARIGLVPTMGFLHEGHLRLVDEARRRSDFVVMSIFVNPLQFGPNEDFERYPRDVAGDTAKAESRGVDLLFVPAVEEMYAGTRTVVVEPIAVADRWEGAVRPGHFRGVLTVVAKLFHLVAPDVAIFGQKDIQQATLIRAMVRDLDFPLEIVVSPTVRESDGLAMSSRNSYLSPDERRRALVLSATLRAIAERAKRGERDAVVLERAGKEVLEREPAVQLDYLALVDPERLEPVAAVSPGTVVMIAARVGRTRLIDNVILDL